MTKFFRLIKDNEILRWYYNWLVEHIHPRYVNITDLLQAKAVERGGVTPNDVRMAKYSGALQFLSIVLTNTTDTETILNEMVKIVSKIKDDGYLDTFIVENVKYLE